MALSVGRCRRSREADILNIAYGCYNFEMTLKILSPPLMFLFSFALNMNVKQMIAF